MKRVISLALCLMLVLGLAATASAANVVNGVTGHTFAAFQIFSGNQGDDASLGEIKWGSGINGASLVKALQINTTTAPYFPEAKVSPDDAAAAFVAEVLGNNETPTEVINHFAQLAYTNRKGDGITISEGEKEIDAGYYLIVDITELDDGDAYNPALLQVTNAGDITITKKYDVPEHDKFVIADDDGDHNAHASAEDSPIGKPVQFHLKAELPLNMTGFEKYTMTFHDDLSDSLDLLPQTIKLLVSDQEVTNSDETSYYTVVTDPECSRDDHDCDFHVVIDDVMLIPGYAAGCDVVVTYSATLNEKAVIGAEGNPNDYYLEYANDPNWDPERPGDIEEQPTGVTPWDQVKVYTTEVEIKKVDGTTDLPLTGAEFTLTGETTGIAKITKNEFVPYTEEDATKQETKYWELKDGTYTTTDPATLTDISSYVNTDAEYSNKTVSEFVDAGKEKTEIKAYVGNDGIVKFAGLGEGTYTVTETAVPDGYNGLKESMTLTIVFHENTATWEHSWTGGATGSGPSIQVDNMKGSVLPETGGIGTTLFYIIGGLLVAGSAVLLVTKKRMNAK